MTAPEDKTLHVLIDGDQIGLLEQGPHGQLFFRDEESWRERRDATPLSLSMSVGGRDYSNTVVEPILRGPLPVKENVLRRWGRRLGVPWKSPLAQLRNVGEDVAGAAQFVRESRLDDATAPGRVETVDDGYIANRLRVLRGDRAAWDGIDSPGQFSLAGAQAKFALYLGRDRQWGLPSGRSAPLGVYPDRKYERDDGGPGAADVVTLLREHIPPSQAAEAAEVFCRALAFNWVIYDPDAHAKNYSILLSGPNVRLAPLYDISSVAPYPDRHDLRHMSMAMSISAKYESSLVTGEDWRRLASALAVDPDQMTTWVVDVLSNAADALADAGRDEDDAIANLHMVHQLVDGVATNAEALLRCVEPPVALRPVAARAGPRPTKPTVASYRRADGTYVKEYPNPRHRW